jgi:aspartate aminotransferase, mitochondrial
MKLSQKSSLPGLVKHNRFLSSWASIPLAPPDKILGLNDQFNKDKCPTKVNLGVGAYRDANGKPFVLNSVKRAKLALQANNLDHEYAGIAGHAGFLKHSLEFSYGKNAEVLTSGRVAAVQSLSGTGACRLVGEFVAKFLKSEKGKTAIHMPDPTWGNHIPIMQNAGLEVVRYRYFDPATRGFDFKGMLADVKAAKNESCFLVHACAHNPTGKTNCFGLPITLFRIVSALEICFIENVLSYEDDLTVTSELVTKITRKMIIAMKEV